MVATFTPNIQLNEPARNDQVGTWDTPVNYNMSLLDLILGGTATIPLNNANITLSAAQYECKQIIFNSTLTGSVSITFPTSFIKSYEIQNACTGTSAFTITLQTTSPGSQVICCPPGDTVECFNNGDSMKFKNLGRVGSYMDYAGSSVPSWITGCTFPPYLNCDGTTFSSAIYPQLTVILGGTTLPDSRGRVRFTLDQSVGRLSSALAGFSPNTVGAAGGSQSHVNTASEAAVLTYSTSFSILPLQFGPTTIPIVNAGSNFPVFGGNNLTTQSLANGGSLVTVSNAGGNTYSILNPAYICGITMIRAG